MTARVDGEAALPGVAPSLARIHGAANVSARPREEGPILATGPSRSGAASRGWIALRRLALGLALVAVLSCSRDQPTAPAGVHALSGRVRLTGYLVNADGSFAGTRVVDDADGVVVELAYGDQIVARTTTVRGAYRFAGLAPGGYQAQVQLAGILSDRTRTLTIVNADLVAGDTLRLRSVGDLYPTPNPSADTVAVIFNVPGSETVALTIRDPSGARVCSLVNQILPSGLYHILWDGRDESARVVTGPLYWITFEAEVDMRAQLLFRGAKTNSDMHRWMGQTFAENTGSVRHGCTRPGASVAQTTP